MAKQAVIAAQKIGKKIVDRQGSKALRDAVWRDMLRRIEARANPPLAPIEETTN